MRQRFPRHPIQVPVLYRRLDLEDPAGADIGWSMDLSEGGARLDLRALVRVGSRLGLVLFTHPEAVEAEARVIWTRKQDYDAVHHGVEFLYLPSTHFTALLKAFPQEHSVRQRAIRLPITLPAQCRAPCEGLPPLRGWTGDISRTGVLLFLPRQLPLNTEAEVTLEDARGKLRLPGRVRWVDGSRNGMGPIRHGIEFLQPPLESRRLLSLFLGTFAKESLADLLVDVTP
ncbi:MAG: PilZ domain-containing protein [Candidatus Methylomirabilales bacterium]